MRNIWLLLALLWLAVPALAQDRPRLTDLLANDTDGRFSMLLAAASAAGMTDTLAGLSDATVLAPTDDAFDATLAYLGLSAQALLADPDTLARVLQFHVLPGRYQLRNLTRGPALATLEGSTVQFALDRGVLTVNGAGIRDVDNLAADGVVVHVIDRMLLPPDLAQAAAANRAHIRLIHLSPDAGALDLLLGDAPTVLQGMTFGQMSDWIEVPAGARVFALAAAGAAPGSSAQAELAPDTWTTLAAVGVAGSADLRLVFLSEDVSPLALGEARLSVLHAVQNAPALDVLLDGRLLIGNLAFPGAAGGNDGFDTRVVSAGSYTLSVNTRGDAPAELRSASMQFTEGYTFLIAIVGTPQQPQLLVRAFNLALLLPPAPPAG